MPDRYPPINNNMPGHLYYEDLILRQATGESLTPIEQTRLDAHLQECDACKHAAMTWDALAVAVVLRAEKHAATLPPLQMDAVQPHLNGKTNATINQEFGTMTTITKTGYAQYRGQRRGAITGRRWLYVAAMLAAVLTAFFAFMGNQDDEPPALFATSIAQEPTATPEAATQLWTVITTEDIAAGDEISRDQLETQRISNADLPEGGLYTFGEQNILITRIGLSTATIDIPAGSIITATMLQAEFDPGDDALREALESAYPYTAYDVLTLDPRLDRFKQLVDDNTEYATLLQSGEPVLVLAYINEAVNDENITILEQLITPLESQYYTEFGAVGGMSFGASNNYGAYPLPGGGAVHVVDSGRIQREFDLDNDVLLQDFGAILVEGYVAINVDVGFDNWADNAPIAGNTVVDIYDDERLLVEGALIIGRFGGGDQNGAQGYLTLAMPPAEALVVVEHINGGGTIQLERSDVEISSPMIPDGEGVAIPDEYAAFALPLAQWPDDIPIMRNRLIDIYQGDELLAGGGLILYLDGEQVMIATRMAEAEVVVVALREGAELTITDSDAELTISGDPAYTLVVMVTATRPISAGTIITDDMLRLDPFPADAVPEGALTGRQGLETAIGRISRENIFENQPLLRAYVEGLVPSTTSYNTLLVVTAIRMIPPGATITPDAVALQLWPDAGMNTDDILLGHNALQDVIGRTARLQINPGLLLESRLEPESATTPTPPVITATPEGDTTLQIRGEAIEVIMPSDYAVFTIPVALWPDDLTLIRNEMVDIYHNDTLIASSAVIFELLSGAGGDVIALGARASEAEVVNTQLGLDADLTIMPAASNEDPAFLPIVKSLTNIFSGTILTAEMLRLVPMAVDAVPPDALTGQSALEAVIGRTTNVDINMNAPILERDLESAQESVATPTVPVITATPNASTSADADTVEVAIP